MTKNEDAINGLSHLIWNAYGSSDDFLIDDIEKWENTIREALKLASGAEEMGKALESIANNTCCDKCNEAAKVAKQALAKFKEIK